MSLSPGTRNLLSEWLQFYNSHIGIGHTYAALKVAREMDAILIEDRMTGGPLEGVVHRRFSDSPRGLGLSQPVVWDNRAITALMELILREDDVMEVERDVWHARAREVFREYASTGYINDFVVRDLLADEEGDRQGI